MAEQGAERATSYASTVRFFLVRSSRDRTLLEMSLDLTDRAPEPPRDSDAWQQLSALVRLHRAELVVVARNQGLSAEEALEHVQDALCTWLEQRRRQQQPAHDAWLATLKLMVKNSARNGRRRHHRLCPHLAIDQLQLAQPHADAEQLVSAAQARVRLQVCVAQLRELERAVISLRLLEERSGEDVASLLGLSRAHVDVLSHRAKATLRACMGGESCRRG
jgi:RNA polymerase sigma-70 factor (ECF subfamily)